MCTTNSLLLAGAIFASQFVEIRRETSFAHTPSANPDIASILYNELTGEISLNAPADGVITTVTMRIVDTLNGAPVQPPLLAQEPPTGTPPPADFLFRSSVISPWEGQDTFLSFDDPTTQGFITAIGIAGTFTMSDGDLMGKLLPPGERDLVTSHILAETHMQGVASVGFQPILIIPEPSGAALAIIALASFGIHAARRRYNRGHCTCTHQRRQSFVRR